MKLKGKVTLYFLMAGSLPLIASVLILYFYLIGGLARIEVDNIRSALGSVQAHFEIEGENLQQKINRALRADDSKLLQIMLTRDRSGQIDQSRLIALSGEYQNLLKLDFLEVISPEGILLASGLKSADFNRGTDFGFLNKILVDKTVLGFAPYSIGEKTYLAYLNGQPLFYKDSIVAVLVGGIFLDNYYLRKLRLPYNVQTALLSENIIFASTFDPPLQTELTHNIRRRVSEEIAAKYRLGDVEYQPYFQTLFSLENEMHFQLMLLYPPSYARLLTAQSFRIYMVVAIAGLLIAGILGYAFAQKLSAPINELSLAAEKISQGEFERKIIWFSNDELGTLVDGFNNMYDRLKKSQQKLIQAEKLAAWNQMARKIAHEIKNPLTPIKISIEDLRRSYHKNEKDYDKILESASDTIITEIDKLKRIVDEFSSFAKLPSPELSEIEAEKLITDSLQLYRHYLENGRIIIQCPERVGRVKADKGLFSQALINLVKNALEADPNWPIIISLARENNQVRIAVRDHGQGIAAQNQSQIFTPYFTTKEGGSGLGLVIAQRILFDHEAEISFNTQINDGAEFIIRIPAMD